MTGLSRRDLWTALGLVALAIGLYVPSVGFGYIDYDDPRILLGQPQLFDQPLGAGITAIFSDLPREEPLLVRDLSWLLDSLVFGFRNPFGHHLGNVILHAASCGLVFLFLRGLRLTFTAALAGAAMFTVHPIHVEPVAWVMGRKDTLSTLLALICLLGFADHLSNRGTRRIVAYGLSLLALALGMLAKINLVAIPGVLFGLIWLWSRRSPLGLKDFLRPLPHTLTAAGCFLWYGKQVQEWGLLGRGPPLLSAANLEHWPTFLPTQVQSIASRFLVPWDYQLFYDRLAIGVPTSWSDVIAGLAIVLLLAGTVAVTAKQAPALAFLLASGAFVMLPYLNLVYIGIIGANRYLLLSSVFLCGAIGIAVDRGWQRSQSSRVIVTVSCCLWLALALVQHSRWLPAWRDNAQLWAYEVTVQEPSLLALQGRARTLVYAAEALPPGPGRDAPLQEAERLVDQGLAQFDALGVVQVPTFYNYQLLYKSKLEHWRGRIAEARGNDLVSALRDYEASHATFPSKLSAFSLARVRIQVASSMITTDPDRAHALAQSAIEALALYAAESGSSRDVQRCKGIAARIGELFPDLQGPAQAAIAHPGQGAHRGHDD